MLDIVNTAIIAVLLVACNGDMSVPPSGNENGAGMLSISFRVAAPIPISRAANTDNLSGYEDGSQLESTIDFASKNFRIYFFDTNHQYITEWQHPGEMHVLAGEYYWRYTFTGTVPKDLKLHNSFSVMVLANWPDYPDFHSISLAGKHIDDIVTADWARFEAFDNFELNIAARRLIPFYGLASFENITFTEGETCDLGDINLLRAMAKIEVILDGFPEDVSVQGAPTIHGINPGGFCAPLGPIGSGNNWHTDYVEDIHLPFGTSNHPEAMNNTAAMLAAGPNKWIAYLPEFRNVGTDEKYSRIELKISHLDEPFVLNFARYDNNGRPDNVNGRYDIRRNDLYRFNVIGDLHEILFKLTVEEWAFGGRTEIDM